MALGFRKSQYNLFSAIIRPLRPLAFISWASSPTNTSPILAIESIRLIIPFVYLSDHFLLKTSRVIGYQKKWFEPAWIRSCDWNFSCRVQPSKPGLRVFLEAYEQQTEWTECDSLLRSIFSADPFIFLIDQLAKFYPFVKCNFKQNLVSFELRKFIC